MSRPRRPRATVIAGNALGTLIALRTPIGARLARALARGFFALFGVRRGIRLLLKLRR